MICRFRGCWEDAEEGKVTCIEHRPAFPFSGSERKVIGECDCGQPAKYTSGLCHTCYVRERRQQRVNLSKDEKKLKQLRELEQQVIQEVAIYMNLACNPMSTEEAKATYIAAVGWNNLALLYPEKEFSDFGVEVGEQLVRAWELRERRRRKLPDSVALMPKNFQERIPGLLRLPVYSDVLGIENGKT